jgi:uncharacterized Tic20 family protein
MSSDTEIMGMKPNTFCMLLHLSQLASFIIPLSGLVIPIVMWVIAKDKSAEADKHGKIVLNWIISVFIYAVVTGLLCVIVIGFFLLPVLAVVAIAFPIIGALKANNGDAWKYPLSITFFK